jgi:hypothetical protein
MNPIIKASFKSLGAALFLGFAYAQIARGIGAPSMVIGITAIVVQALAFVAAMMAQLGKFWRRG